MPRERIKSKKELSDFVARRYAMYRQNLSNEHSEHISKYYLTDFLTDLLIIQAFANSEEEDVGEKRAESLADLS